MNRTIEDHAPVQHYPVRTIVQYDPRFDHMRNRNSLQCPRINPIAYFAAAVAIVVVAWVVGRVL